MVGRPLTAREREVLAELVRILQMLPMVGLAVRDWHRQFLALLFITLVVAEAVIAAVPAAEVIKVEGAADTRVEAVAEVIVADQFSINLKVSLFYFFP